MNNKERIEIILEKLIDETLELKNELSKIKNKLTNRLFQISRDYEIIGNEVLKIKENNKHKLTIKLPKEEIPPKLDGVYKITFD
tara:strand:+ start:45 stop:296 length:252 start_codon:yes stop_codon:yes gene_type:complete